MGGPSPNNGSPSRGSPGNINDVSSYPPLGLRNTTTTSDTTFILRITSTVPNTTLSPLLVKATVDQILNKKTPASHGHSEGNGKAYTIKVVGEREKKKLLETKKLINGTPIQVDEHPTANKVRGVIFSRDCLNISEEDLLEGLKSQGALEVRRISKRQGEQVISTPTIIVTFAGTTLPHMVSCGYAALYPRTYYPTPMQCYKCYAFGHTKVRCQQEKVTCYNCGETGHLEDKQKCDKPSHCTHCKSNEHPVSSRKCPLYIKENEIQRLKIDHNTSYPDARRLWEKEHKKGSFAETLAKGSDSANISTLVQMLQQQQEENKNLLKKITELQQNKTKPNPPPRNDDMLKEILNKMKEMETNLCNVNKKLEETKAENTRLLEENTKLNETIKKRKMTEKQKLRQPQLEGTPVSKLSKSSEQIDKLKSPAPSPSGGAIYTNRTIGGSQISPTLITHPYLTRSSDNISLKEMEY